MRKTTRDAAKRIRAFHHCSLPQTEVNSVVEQFYTSLDTPISLSCWLLYEAGEFDQLVSKEINPLDYIEMTSFRDDFAAISFLRKSEFIKTTFDKREEALATFRDAEQQCCDTNKRFRNLSLDPQFRGSNVWLLNATCRKIDRILGGFDIDELFDSGSFGPGASTLVKGKDTSSVRKFREERQITSSLYQLLGPLFPSAYPLWYRDGRLAEIEYRESSKVITVPKNAKTDRTIAVEPGLNVWFQKGLGKMIRRRLRWCGLNLDDSGRNQSLAKAGSLSQQLATVDFSSASDTISKLVVKELIPPIWHTLLDSSRSRCYDLQGKISTFEKFSSMGNGFTFELESLIFYAAAIAVCEKLGLNQNDVSVFGDDVVLPVEGFQLFCDFTKFLGFTVNPRKSFSKGYFRESCGSYYYAGCDVKPFFFRKALVDASRIYGFANSISDLSSRRVNNLGRDSRFRRLHITVLRTLPPLLRVYGDKKFGNGCIWSNFDQAHPSKLRDQLEGYTFMAFLFQAVELETDSPALLCARLKYTSRDMGLMNSYPLRAVTKTRFCRVSVQQWYNWGQWI